MAAATPAPVCAVAWPWPTAAPWPVATTSFLAAAPPTPDLASALPCAFAGPPCACATAWLLLTAAGPAAAGPPGWQGPGPATLHGATPCRRAQRWWCWCCSSCLLPGVMRADRAPVIIRKATSRNNFTEAILTRASAAVNVRADHLGLSAAACGAVESADRGVVTQKVSGSAEVAQKDAAHRGSRASTSSRSHAATVVVRLDKLD